MSVDGYLPEPAEFGEEDNPEIEHLPDSQSHLPADMEILAMPAYPESEGGLTTFQILSQLTGLCDVGCAVHLGGFTTDFPPAIFVIASLLRRLGEEAGPESELGSRCLQLVKAAERLWSNEQPEGGHESLG